MGSKEQRGHAKHTGSKERRGEADPRQSVPSEDWPGELEGKPLSMREFFLWVSLVAAPPGAMRVVAFWAQLFGERVAAEA